MAGVESAIVDQENKFQAAVKAFQKKKGLKADGGMGAQSRKALITEYMAAEGSCIPDGMQMTTLACGQRHMIEDTQGDSETNRRVDVLAFESAPIKPAPSECSGGKHPGCRVYDQWIAEVKGDMQ